MHVYETYYCWDNEEISVNNIIFTETFDTGIETDERKCYLKDISNSMHKYVGKKRVIRITASGNNFSENHIISMNILKMHIRSLNTINNTKPKIVNNVNDKIDSLIDSILGGIKNVHNKRKT